jgi:outer membrane lipoprotein LolB
VTRLSWAVLALALSACATLPPPLSQEAAEKAWQVHEAQVNKVHQWRLAARLAINTEDEGWNGQLQWRQAPTDFQIAFNAPFGQGALQLTGGEQGVTLQLSDGQTHRASNAEALLYEQLGWRLPVEGLRYWVTGLPAPGQPSVVEYDGQGRLAELRQADWSISYPDYRRIQGIDLPRKVFIENHHLSVRLVIDRWELNSGA